MKTLTYAGVDYRYHEGKWVDEDGGIASLETSRELDKAFAAASRPTPPEGEKEVAMDVMAEFVMPKQHCCLCGNYGIIDTRGKMFTPAGFECGDRVFCVCPNGRAMKEQGADLHKNPSTVAPTAPEGIGDRGKWYRRDIHTNAGIEWQICQQVTDGVPDKASAIVKVIAQTKSRDHADEICRLHNSRARLSGVSEKTDWLEDVRHIRVAATAVETADTAWIKSEAGTPGGAAAKQSLFEAYGRFFQVMRNWLVQKEIDHPETAAFKQDGA